LQAFLRSDCGQSAGQIGSYCSNGVCGDAVGDTRPQGPVLVAKRGRPVILTFGHAGPPATLSVRRYDPPGYATGATVNVAAANPTQFVLNLAPGEYNLMVAAAWEGPHTDAAWSFAVRVV
jgi:hypothetical protein